MLKLVLPTGSLEQSTLELFNIANLMVIRNEERSYKAKINDSRIEEVVLLRPQEIAQYVDQGLYDLGITGLDWILESQATNIIEIANLTYSKQTNQPVKIVLAVAKESGIKALDQINPGAKISTEYVNLAREYFAKLNIPVNIEFSFGATEAKVPKIADAVIELIETGSTLRANSLLIIDELLESSTKLIANKQAYKDSTKREVIEDIKTLLLGVLLARDKVLIKLNVSETNFDRVIALLPALRAPTISQLFSANTDNNYWAVETVAEKQTINLLIPKLKQAGAEDILELPINKIIR